MFSILEKQNNHLFRRKIGLMSIRLLNNQGQSGLMIKYVISSIILICLFGGIAYGSPSRHIAKAMDTPVSVFDMFLLAIELYEKCPTGKKLMSMESIVYDFADNLIRMEYSVKPENIEGFKEGNEELRKRLLMKKLGILATYIGVKDSSSKDFGLGPIWGMPIRRGWKSKDFDELKFREEVVKRTVIILRTTIDISALSTKEYKATRNHHGKTEVEVSEWENYIRADEVEGIK